MPANHLFAATVGIKRNCRWWLIAMTLLSLTLLTACGRTGLPIQAQAAVPDVSPSPIAARISGQTSVAAYANIRRAYRLRDAALAAQSYTDDAKLIYAYTGDPIETHVGRNAIQSSFQTFFERFPAEDVLDLNFRLDPLTTTQQHGVYRLKIGNTYESYGRFSVNFPDNDFDRFQTDQTTEATLSDFESMPGPVLLDADNESLSEAFYSELSGRYQAADGCDWVITKSTRRLFVRNDRSTCLRGEASVSMDPQPWRGLTRISGLQWVAGNKVISDDQHAQYRFDRIDGNWVLTRLAEGMTTVAKKRLNHRLESFRFEAADGTQLSGIAYVPNKPSGYASVMVHGSGAQDRHGYASIMAVMAESLVNEGELIVSFDKRGVGESDGDYSRQDFAALAADVLQARENLAKRYAIPIEKVGLVGSSQAGWIIAEAIAQTKATKGLAVRRVFLIGAAGAALNVAEQNLYYTETAMRCAGISEASNRLALAQQQAFFDAMADSKLKPKLDRITRQSRLDTSIADWIFPGSEGLAARESDGPLPWYQTLPVHADPLPIWQRYRGSAYFVFAQFDDSTPTSIVTQRLSSITNKSVQILTIPNAQHLGLQATSVCESDVANRTAFHPELFNALAQYAAP